MNLRMTTLVGVVGILWLSGASVAQDDLGRLTLEAFDPPHVSQPSPPGRFLIAKDVTVTWSESGDLAWGFNKATGKWTRQVLDPPIDGQPQAGDKIALFQDETTVYAYSGEAGRWDVLRLPSGLKAKPMFETDLILVADGQDIYTFAAKVGRWTSPTGKAVGESALAGQPTVQWPGYSPPRQGRASAPPHAMDADASQKLAIFSLRTLLAQDAADIMSSLFDDVRFAAESKTNQLVVSGSEPRVQMIEAALVKLDKHEPEVDTAAPEKFGEMGAFDRSFLGDEDEDEPVHAQHSTASLEAAYEEKEAQVTQTVKQLQVQIAQFRKGFVPSEAVDRLRSHLRKQVAVSFAARQELHRSQLAELEKRSRALAEKIRLRDNLQEQIIDQRIDELVEE